MKLNVKNVLLGEKKVLNHYVHVKMVTLIETECASPALTDVRHVMAMLTNVLNVQKIEKNHQNVLVLMDFMMMV